ncbi:MAG: ankyrin repeat domain-containing protein [Pseudomonadota bacterium]
MNEIVQHKGPGGSLTELLGGKEKTDEGHKHDGKGCCGHKKKNPQEKFWEACGKPETDYQTLEDWLKTGNVKVDAVNDADGTRPLHIAIKAGNAAAVKCLLDNGADVHNKYKHRDAAGYAILNGDPDIVGLIFNMYPELVNKTLDQSGLSPLSYAASLANRDIVELLLERGANVNLTDVTAQSLNEDLQKTPIAKALCSQDHDLSNKDAAKNRMAIARSLIESGANLTIFPEGFNFGGDSSLIPRVKERQNELINEADYWTRSPNYTFFVELFGKYEYKISLSDPLTPLFAKNEPLGTTESSTQDSDRKTMANFLVEYFVNKMAGLKKPYQQDKLMRDFQLILARFSEAGRNCIFKAIEEKLSIAKKDTSLENSKIVEGFNKLYGTIKPLAMVPSV